MERGLAVGFKLVVPLEIIHLVRQVANNSMPLLGDTCDDVFYFQRQSLCIRLMRAIIIPSAHCQEVERNLTPLAGP